MANLAGQTYINDINLTGLSNINADSITVTDMSATNLTVSVSAVIPRQSTPPVKTLLGSTIDLGLLVQNLDFNTTNRQFEIWDDAATGQMMIWDVSDNVIQISPNTLSIYPTSLDLNCPAITFTDSSVSFPNSTVAFNTNLPTTTITAGFANNNFITKAYGDSVYHPSGSYASLSGNNIYTGTNQFNTNLPTSTIGTTTGGTQFITRAIADGRYGQLATANIWTAQNTFRNGILPCTTLTTTNIQLGGNNQLQYRQATSLNNISIGDQTIQGDTDAVGRLNNTGSRNIGIGAQVLPNLDSGSDMIFIGYQAGQLCGSTRINQVQPQKCIAIGTFSQKKNLYMSDSISIGYNSLSTSTGPSNQNICIGSNVGNGINFQQYNVLIGGLCAPTVNDNAVTAIGYQCLGNVSGQANSITACGWLSGYEVGNGAYNTLYGTEAGATLVGGSNSFFGFRAGKGSTTTVNNTTCIGAFSSALASNECVIGGSTTTEQQFLTLPQKCKLYCNQLIGAVATYNISWRSNENVIINSATTTQINLPQATTATAVRLGAIFNIIRTSGATSNCIISAYGTETIFYSGSASTSVPIDSWVNSISFVCVNNVAGSPMWAVCRYNDRVTLATDARKLQTLSDSTNVNYPICFTTIATTGYNNVYANSNLTYNPAQNMMTLQNLTVSGSLNGTSSISNASTITDKTTDTNINYINFTTGYSGTKAVSASSDLLFIPSTRRLSLSAGTFEVYKMTSSTVQFNNIPSLITGATTLTHPLLALYTFTMKTSASYNITIPEITSLTVGTQIFLKRMGGAVQPLFLDRPNSQAIYINNSQTTITNPSIILTGSQSNCQLVAIQTGDVGAGTFSNSAGTNVINILTQTSGTLAIGSKIYLGGVLGYRFISGYGAGVYGGIGSYNVDSTLPSASTNIAYTTEITYGWAVVSIA